MHYEFCTLFDRNYLFKGLALHESLERHVGDFTLWVLCMDDVVYDVLEKMHLPRLELISLAQFEDDALLRAKATRTPVEYCWTCTPSLPLYLLDHVPGIEMVTYLDADLYFFGDPGSVYAELGRGSIGIVGHRFSAADEHQAQASGIYNVAFMVFKKDEHARECLEWWRDRCNEWCYARFEEGRYGDQKYLDDWPERFARVVVLQDRGVGLAPWNLRSQRISMRGGRLLVDGEPLIFYHFHSFLIAGNGKQFRLADPCYRLGRRGCALVYRAYVASVERAMTRVRQTIPDYAYGITSARLDTRVMRLAARAGRQAGRAERALMRVIRVIRATPGRRGNPSAFQAVVPPAVPPQGLGDADETRGVDSPDGSADGRDAG
jgi:hypothetical protein